LWGDVAVSLVGRLLLDVDVDEAGEVILKLTGGGCFSRLCA
jgi:hypothetical protein